MVEGVWTMAGKGIDTRHALHVSRARSPADAADTIRDRCWQRSDLTWEHNLGLSPGREAGLLGSSGPKPRRIAGRSEDSRQTGSRLRAAGQATSGPHKAQANIWWPSFGIPQEVASVVWHPGEVA